MYCIKFSQSRMKGERHRLSPLSLQFQYIIVSSPHLCNELRSKVFQGKQFSGFNSLLIIFNAQQKDLICRQVAFLSLLNQKRVFISYGHILPYFVFVEPHQFELQNQTNNSCYIELLVWFGFMVFNATFNNISVTSWRSILFVEETGENHQPAASH